MFSQSGTYVTQTLPYLGKTGDTVQQGHQRGQRSNISIIDALEYLGDDESDQGHIPLHRGDIGTWSAF